MIVPVRVTPSVESGSDAAGDCVMKTIIKSAVETNVKKAHTDTDVLTSFSITTPFGICPLFGKGRAGKAIPNYEGCNKYPDFHTRQLLS
jgi:hypothetical protein